MIWSDESVDWSAFNGVVVRSCWDYHLNAGSFRRWLDRLDSLGVRVWNSTSLVRWNMDKAYLLELAARGVPTVPTLIVPAGATPHDVEGVARAEGWSHVVIKPAISASGHETYEFHLPFDERARAGVARVAAHGRALVQPFADEVGRDGELSFIFIDGALSHAAVKRTRAGEFRVQTEHGGSVASADPPPDLAQQARLSIDALPELPLYARVDGISRNGAFLLMELELIEPNLFLACLPSAVDRFARAIVARLQH